jgi:homoserine O-acetyltransferase
VSAIAKPSLRHPALRPDWIDRPHEIQSLGDLPLESGAAIRDAHLCYVTHGTLNAARDNAILVLSAIGATHHRLDFLIGPGRALDPQRHCIVCVDALGNGLSISPSNSRAQPGMGFPRFSIRDMVASQARLIDALGIARLAAVCGASMGGMQALQWGASDPTRVGKLIAMTPMTRTSSWSRAIAELSRQALMLDPAWTGERFAGTPTRGYALWAGLMRVLASRTPDALARSLPDPAGTTAYLAELGEDAAINGPDPIDWIYQTWAYDGHDVGQTPGCGGSIEAALGRAVMPALVLAPPVDLYNPPDEARRAAALLPRGTFVEIPSVEGHQAASAVDARDAALLNRTIGRFLVEV